ncbi:MAG: acyl-CoA thioesterase [Pseudomonadota bacterium]
MTAPSDTSIFEATYPVSFGDCDPAGIVFYPNMFAWLDRTFHAYLLAKADGHPAVSKALGVRGIGLKSAHCDFRSPVAECDDLVVAIRAIEYNPRDFRVIYQGLIGERLAFEGYEDRALFIFQEGRIRAGDPALLRDHLASFSAN